MDEDHSNPSTPRNPQQTTAISLEALQQAMPGLRRLLVGGAINGAEELIRLLRQWEDELEELRSNPAQPVSPRDLDEPGEPFLFSQPPAQESDADLLRYALVGWLAEAEARLKRRLNRVDRASRALHRLVDPWIKPIRSSRLVGPLRTRAELLQNRGKEELNRWIELGRVEELRSRDLARLALKRTVDQNIQYLATNPAVEELVETQSTSLADEVVEEVRERTVSADTFLEGLARAMLRRAPRSQPPEVPEHIRKSAEGKHKARKPTRRR